MKNSSTWCGRLLVALAFTVLASRPTLAIQTQEVDIGRSGVYDGVVKIERDTIGRMTLRDVEVTSPVTLSDLRYRGTAHWLLQGLDHDDHPLYHTDARALTWLTGRSTSDLPEGVRLYHTDARSRQALSAASPLSYAPATGVFSLDPATTPTFTGLKLTGLPTGAVPYANGGGALCANTNRLAILPSGNVGIGTASPATTLDVAGPISFGKAGQFNAIIKAVADSNMYFQAGGANTRFMIEATGNVGIGTICPATRLDVNGSARIRGVLAVDSETTTGAINIAGRKRLVPSAVQSLSTDTQTVYCNAGLIVLDAPGNRALVSTPTISAGVEGQLLTIVNQSPACYVRLNDADMIPGTNLALASTTRTLYKRDVLTLIYAGGMWCEVNFASNH